MYKLSIVIPVYNNYNFTVKCLEDLQHLPKDHEIIVVDNGSTDNTQHLKSEDSRLRIIRNDINLGFGRACNIGFKMSSGDNVMFLNNDVRVKNNKETWTQSLIEDLKDNIVGPMVGILDSNFNFVKESERLPKHIDDVHVYMSGWCIAANIKTWNKLLLDGEDGPWHSPVTNGFFAYFEDTDLSMRCRQQEIPFKIVQIPVHHFGRMTGKTLNLPEMYKQSRAKFLALWKDKELKKPIYV